MKSFIMNYLFWILAALCAIDIAQTLYGVGNGYARELNPLINAIGIPSAAILLCTLLILHGWAGLMMFRRSKWAAYALIAQIAVRAFIVLINFKTLSA